MRHSVIRKIELFNELEPGDTFLCGLNLYMKMSPVKQVPSDHLDPPLVNAVNLVTGEPSCLNAALQVEWVPGCFVPDPTV